MNTNEIETMIAYDGKNYECLRCNAKTNRCTTFKNRSSFIRHCKTKTHTEECERHKYATYYPSMDGLFTRLLYHKTEQLSNYLKADGGLRRWVLQYDDGLWRGDYAERYIREKGLTNEILNVYRELKELNDMRVLDRYMKGMIQKVLWYRTKVLEIIRESGVLCDDITGIVMQYI